MSLEDHKFMQIVESSIKFEGGHYSLCLTLKEVNVLLNTLEVTEKRLHCPKRKLEYTCQRI